MIKTLINPRYSDQTAGTIGHTGWYNRTTTKVTHTDVESIDEHLFYQLLFIYSSTKYNTLSINTDQGIVSADSLILLPIQRTTAIKLL